MTSGTAGGPSGSPDFGDVFADYFGGGGTGAARGRDITIGLELPASELAAGVTRSLAVPMQIECRACAGSGSAPGTEPAACQRCGGTGHVLRTGRQRAAPMRCVTCNGTGSVPAHACPSCHGDGRVPGERVVQVAIPAGAGHGQRLRVPGKGGAARPGGARGDLFIQLDVPPADRPRIAADVVVRNPPSRSITRVILAAAWLAFALYLSFSHPACQPAQLPASGCQSTSGSLATLVLVVAVPLLIAAASSAYAHVVLTSAGIRPAGLRALVTRRARTYAWDDITSVTLMTTSHRWTFFTVYVSRRVELRLRSKTGRVGLPAPRAGLLVSERQFRETASVIHKTWLQQTGRTA
jgi:DnaJ C terminal domain/DnaJ central domain